MNTVSLPKLTLIQRIRDGIWDDTANDLMEQNNIPDSEEESLKRSLDLFKRNFDKRWATANRNIRGINPDWLNSPLIFKWTPASPEETSASGKKGRKTKPIDQSSDRSVRRKLADNFGDVSSDTAKLLYQNKLHKEGKRSVSKVIMDVTRSPTSHLKYRNAINKPDVTPYSPTEAVALMSRNKLTKSVYQDLRNGAKDRGAKAMYPSYNIVRTEKEKCYPDYSVSESEARVNLQSLVDLTLNRTLSSRQSVLTVAESQNITEWTAIFKYGMDGTTGQSTYKQKFTNPDNTDASFFVASCVLLRIQATAADSTVPIVLYKNPHPSSSACCRPVFLLHAKETPELCKLEASRLKETISKLQPTSFLNADTGRNHILKCTFHFTMVDGKLVDALTDNSHAASCSLCRETPSAMNLLIPWSIADVDPSFLQYSLSPLHCYIRCEELILHIGYKLDVKQHRKTKDVKDNVEARKKEIQTNFWTEAGLIVDKPKSGGSGNTNDGNSARRFFKHPDVSSRITGVNKELIDRFAIILQTINSGYPINSTKFGKYCDETSKLYVELYPWYVLPPSVHKILVHGEEITR